MIRQEITYGHIETGAFNRGETEGIIKIMDLPSVENIRRQHINIISESWLLLTHLTLTLNEMLYQCDNG